MRKRRIEFLRKFENRGIKMARVNSNFITKSLNLQLFSFCMVLGVRCDGDIFKPTPLIDKFMFVNICWNLITFKTTIFAKNHMNFEPFFKYDRL